MEEIERRALKLTLQASPIYSPHAGTLLHSVQTESEQAAKMLQLELKLEAMHNELEALKVENAELKAKLPPQHPKTEFPSSMCTPSQKKVSAAHTKSPTKKIIVSRTHVPQQGFLFLYVRIE